LLYLLDLFDAVHGLVAGVDQIHLAPGNAARRKLIGNLYFVKKIN
jgi:hypothetical protein